MYLPYFLKKYPGNHFGAGNLIFLISSELLEGFEILCTGFDHILEKSGELFKDRISFKGGY